MLRASPGARGGASPGCRRLAPEFRSVRSLLHLPQAQRSRLIESRFFIDLFDFGQIFLWLRDSELSRSCRACLCADDFDRTEAFVLFPVGFAELVELEQRPDGQRFGQPVLAFDRFVKVEARRAFKKRADVTSRCSSVARWTRRCGIAICSGTLSRSPIALASLSEL